MTNRLPTVNRPKLLLGLAIVGLVGLALSRAAQGEAEAQKILATGLSDQVLRLRQIEALQKIADNKGSKVVVLGGNDKNVLIQP
jgi:regulator of protease activity HflC (stomatin/prohibitin superfamily)